MEQAGHKLRDLGTQDVFSDSLYDLCELTEILETTAACVVTSRLRHKRQAQTYRKESTPCTRLREVDGCSGLHDPAPSREAERGGRRCAVRAFQSSSLGRLADLEDQAGLAQEPLFASTAS